MEEGDVVSNAPKEETCNLRQLVTMTYRNKKQADNDGCILKTQRRGCLHHGP